MSKRIADLEHEVSNLRRVLDTKRHLKEVFDRYGAEQLHRFIGEKLNAVSETNNVWVAVHAILDQQIMAEHNATRDPGLSNEGVRFNLGRESSLEDFRHNLLESWAQANRQVKAG